MVKITCSPARLIMSVGLPQRVVERIEEGIPFKMKGDSL